MQGRVSISIIPNCSIFVNGLIQDGNQYEKEIRVFKMLVCFFYYYYHSIKAFIEILNSQCPNAGNTAQFSEKIFCVIPIFSYTPDIGRSCITQLDYLLQQKSSQKLCGHCTSFVHPSNYTAPGVIHGIKSGQALEHWLRNVCKCIARSGSSTLWLRAHFSRLSFDIGKFSHYFSTSCCCQVTGLKWNKALSSGESSYVGEEGEKNEILLF